MNRSNSFHAKTPRWILAVLIVAATLVLPGKAMVLGENAPRVVPGPSATISVAAINHAAQCVAFSPDSRILAGGMRDGKLTFWDASNGKKNKTVATGKSRVRAIMFLPDGKNVLTAAQSIKQWNMKTGQCTKSVDIEDAKTRTSIKAFSHDGAYVAGTSERTLLLWDVNTGRKKQACSLIGLGLATAFSPDDRLVAVGTMVPMGDNEMKSGVQIWDVKTGQLKRTILEPTGSISGLAFSHNGKLLAGGTHREVIVWDADTSAVQKRLPSGHGPIESIAFSPDDGLLAAGGQGPMSRTRFEMTIVSELNVWNLASGKKVLSYLGALARCTSVVFSHNGKRIAACDDREVAVHDLQEKEPVWTEHFEMEVAPDEPRTTRAANGPRAVSGDAALKASADRDPMLTEIAKANDAAWAAIRSMDVEYARTERIVSEKTPRQSESTGRWLKDGDRERLRQNSVFTCQLENGKTSSGRFEYDDYYNDGTKVRHVQERDRKSSDRRTLSVVDPKRLDGLVGYIYKGPRSVARGDCPITEPQVLRYFRCRYDDPPMTLAEIIAAWKVTLKGKTTTAAKETLWRLHAERPVRSDAPSEVDGSYIDFYVNADKGFMVQKAVSYTAHSHLIDGKSIGSCRSLEVKEFQACGDGVFFPKRIECRKQIGVERISSDRTDCVTFVASKLSVNSPVAGDAFDFRIPAGVAVYEFDKNLSMDEGKVYIWGADNKPAQKFASEREYLKPQYARHFEEMRQKAERNLASKKPKDLAERVEYYLSTRKYGEAIVACSQWIATGPTPQNKARVVCYRGMAYLLKQDYGKAIVDLTEAMRLADKPDDKEGVCLYWAIAYASQDDTLNKAVKDLAKIENISRSGPDDFGSYWVSLLRAAARIRRLHTAGAVQDKAQAQRDVVAIINDIQQAMNIWPSPEAVALMACFFGQDKSSNARAYLASLREAVKRQPKKEFPLDDGTLMVDIDAAVCKCLVRLVPEIEKELKAMQKGELPK